MEPVKRITSFEVDHNRLTPGIYVSRKDGDVTTYDLRMRTPNAGDYMSNLAMHSLEHMFATYIRNGGMSDRIIYFGPMGCQTGFYLLVRDAGNDEVLAEVKNVLRKITAHSGAMFGASAAECGNYRNLSVDEAKTEAARYLEVLENRENDFLYK